MKDTKDFYESYWKDRQSRDYLYSDAVPARLRAVVNFISPGDNQQVTVLDVGCGEGTLGRLLKEKFGSQIYRVGLDLSETALALAAPHYDETYQMNIELDSWPQAIQDRQFDYIVCVEVLEHLFMPEKLLESFKHRLAPGGFIIASFPNFAYYKNRYDVLRGHFPRSQHIFHDAEHIHYFTLHSFSRLLNSVGLEIVGLDGSYYLPWLANRLPEEWKRRAFHAFPNLFGNQVVVKARIAS